MNPTISIPQSQPTKRPAPIATRVGRAWEMVCVETAAAQA
jgi:hypothetical protein